MRSFRSAHLAVAAGAALAAMMPGLGPEMSRVNVPSPTRIQRKRNVTPTYGERECARRRRQIAAGSLTESNGLVR